MSLRREAVFTWIVSHRGWVVAAGLVLSAAAGAYSATVPIDYGMEQFFPVSGPERETYDTYREHFSKEDTQFALFWQDRRAPGAALYEDLRAAAGLFEEAGLEDVRWFGNVDVTERVDLDGEPATRIYRLVDEPDVGDGAVRAMLERHRDNELYVGYLWNADQTVFAVHGYLDPDLNTDARRREVEERLTESLRTLERGQATATLAGIPVFRSRIPKMLETDQALFLGGGFVLFFGILLYFFRHVGHVTLCLVPVLAAYLGTVALIGLSGRSVTILTSFIPIIALVVGVSDAIHLLARYRSDRRRLEENDAAIVATFTRLSGPCLYTSLTTAIGFSSLVATRIPMVVEFGLFTGIAIVLTYVFAMTLLPALLGFSARMEVDDRGLEPRWMRRTVEAALALPGRHARSVVLAVTAVSVAALALGSTLRVNTYLLDDMKRNSPVIQDMEWIEASGFGLFQVNVFLRSDAADELHGPRMLAWMRDLEEFARRDPIVVGALGLPDLVTELRASVTDEDHALPDTPEEASQLLLLADMGGGGGIEDVYLKEEGVAQIVLTVQDRGSVEMLPFLQRIDGYIADNPPPTGVAATTGTVQMAQTYSTRLVRTFGPSLALAVGLVFLVMTHMFRSLRLGLLALAPNVFPLVVLVGAMALGGIDLKPSTILVFSIAFGLAVDDTMHLLARVRERLVEGDRVEEAVEVGLRDTAPAILMTSIAMSLGFSLLVASQFQVLALVGVMTAVSIVAAVAADLFALPSLVALLSAEGRPLPSSSGATAMKSIALALPLLLVPAVGRGQTADERSAPIVAEAERRVSGYGDFTASLTMTLRDEDGDERTRGMRILGLEVPDDGDKTLVVFDTPRDLQGTSILTVTHRNERSEQWLYLPALRRARRIATSDQSDAFMGSEFTYEDVGSQEFDKYGYRYLREESLAGTPTHVLERTPNDEDSAYTRQIIWLDTAAYRVLRIDYYAAGPDRVKSLTVEGYDEYEGGQWRPRTMTMTDHASGRSTTLTWTDYRFATGLTDQDFDPRRLGRSR